nr:hypothetical protein [Actinomycetota bacterium]
MLTYPYASSGTPDAMYWQARDGLHFALEGGRALVPGADGRHSDHVDPLTGSDALLDATSFGFGDPAPPSARAVRALAASLRTWGVNDVVVVDEG